MREDDSILPANTDSNEHSHRTEFGVENRRQAIRLLPLPHFEVGTIWRRGRRMKVDQVLVRLPLVERKMPPPDGYRNFDCFSMPKCLQKNVVRTRMSSSAKSTFDIS